MNILHISNYTRQFGQFGMGKKNCRHIFQEKTLDNRDLTLLNEEAPQNPASLHVKQGIKINKSSCVIKKRSKNDKTASHYKTHLKVKITLKIEKTCFLQP